MNSQTYFKSSLKPPVQAAATTLADRCPTPTSMGAIISFKFLASINFSVAHAPEDHEKFCAEAGWGYEKRGHGERACTSEASQYGSGAQGKHPRFLSRSTCAAFGPCHIFCHPLFLGLVGELIWRRQCRLWEGQGGAPSEHGISWSAWPQGDPGCFFDFQCHWSRKKGGLQLWLRSGKFLPSFSHSGWHRSRYLSQSPLKRKYLRKFRNLLRVVWTATMSVSSHTGKLVLESPLRWKAAQWATSASCASFFIFTLNSKLYLVGSQLGNDTLSGRASLPCRRSNEN